MREEIWWFSLASGIGIPEAKEHRHFPMPMHPEMFRCQGAGWFFALRQMF
jgi:hypothetical protein